MLLSDCMGETALIIQDLAIILFLTAMAGYLCRRIGLSPIIGYLMAGMLIGGLNELEIYQRDTLRIRSLAGIGMVFVLFSLGLNLRLDRLRQMGAGPFIATIVTVVVVFNIVRIAGGLLGMSMAESLFFGGMLSVSSSVIVVRVIADASLSHQRAGHLGQSMTLIEDLMAVGILTLLGSYARLGSVDTTFAELAADLAILIAFVVLLLVAGLLVIPVLLRRFARRGAGELESTLVAGLLFGMAVLTLRAGYPLGLGAFVLGMIVAGSVRGQGLTRSFSGLRDVFTALFFGCAGLLIDLQDFRGVLPLILAGTLLVLLLRPLVAFSSLVLVGEKAVVAFRTAVCILPIGEFSFMIASLGLTHGILVKEYAAAMVGISILTGILGSVLAWNSERMEGLARFRIVGFLQTPLLAYERFFRSMHLRGRGAILWKLLRVRLVQMSIHVACTTALIILAHPLYEVLRTELEFSAGRFHFLLPGLYTTAVALLCLGPIVAILRNIDAISLMLAQFALGTSRRNSRLQALLQNALRGLSTFLLLIWLLSFVPLGAAPPAVVGLLAIFVLFLVVVGWRRWIRWHSQLEYTVRMRVDASEDSRRPDWASVSQSWDLALGDCAIPDGSPFGGRTLEEIRLRHRADVTVVGIERNGIPIINIEGGTRVFPGDVLLLLGTRKRVAQARHLLASYDGVEFPSKSDLRDQVLETFVLPANSPLCGRTLGSLELIQRFGVQIVAIRRVGQQMLSPGADTELHAGDACLVLGTTVSIDVFGQRALPENGG